MLGAAKQPKAFIVDWDYWLYRLFSKPQLAQGRQIPDHSDSSNLYPGSKRLEPTWESHNKLNTHNNFQDRGRGSWSQLCSLAYLHLL